MFRRLLLIFHYYHHVLVFSIINHYIICYDSISQSIYHHYYVISPWLFHHFIPKKNKHYTFGIFDFSICRWKTKINQQKKLSSRNKYKFHIHDEWWWEKNIPLEILISFNLLIEYHRINHGLRINRRPRIEKRIYNNLFVDFPMHKTPKIVTVQRRSFFFNYGTITAHWLARWNV